LEQKKRLVFVVIEKSGRMRKRCTKSKEGEPFGKPVMKRVRERERESG
jgi:hypothetical protein